MGIFQRLSKNEFYRNVFTLFTGSVIAQAITFLITPVLTRIYPDFQFGIFFLFTSITLTISSSACLQYDAAIILPKDEDDALNLLTLSLVISILFSILTAVIFFYFSGFLCKLFKNDSIRHYFYLVPISVFILSMNQAITVWNNRKKQYRFISVNNVTRSVSAGAFQSLAGFGKILQPGLIFGNLFGQFIALLFQIRKVILEMRNYYKMISIKRMYYLAKVYKNMPIFNTISNITNNLSNQLPVFLLTRFFGVNSASYYGLSNRIVSTPMGLIGQSIAQVFIQDAAESRHLKKNMYGLLKKMYWRLFKIAIIPFIVLFIASPLIFKLILGDTWDWNLAGSITRILIPWLFVMFLNSPIIQIVNVLQKQSVMTIYTVTLLVFRFLSIWIGFLVSKDLLFALFMFSLTGFLFNLFFLIYLLKISKDVKD
jgi:lipopolysaccharide exporter